MKNLLVMLVFVVALPAHAGPRRFFQEKVQPYVSTHKILLTYDATSFAGPFADAASTAHCLHSSPNCFEENGALPLRPSNARLYLSASLVTAGLIIGGHALWHFLPHSDVKQMLPAIGGTVLAGDILLTKHNISTSAALVPR